MRVLITGGAGFIGSHTADALLARGDTVRVLDRLEPPVHGPSWPAYLSSDVEPIHGDTNDPQALRTALDGAEAVFHFAAYQDYLTDFSHFFQTNVVGTALLYEIIVNEHLPIRRIVVASSQAVYGEGKYQCATHGVTYPDQRMTARLESGEWNLTCDRCDRVVEPLWTDEAVVRPHNSYAMSKRGEEELALALGRRYGIPTVAMRYSIVQGPRQSFRNAYSGALRTFAVRVLSGRPPIVYEDGQQLRDFVSIHDVVRANLLVLDDPRADFQAFNVGGARKVPVLELARMVIEQAGAAFEPELPGLFRGGDTRHVFSDVSRLRALGWEPRVSQVDAVREYLTWAAAQPDLEDTSVAARQRMVALGVLGTARVVTPGTAAARQAG